ncbi:MAG: RluA family pseudouridine synthase [Phycisphaerae bacterium]
MHKTVTILDFLRRQYPRAKTTTLRRMIQNQRVTINGQPVRSLKQLLPADAAALVGDAAAGRAMPAPELPDAVQSVYADADVLVVNKPSGLLTATHAGEHRPTLLAGVNRVLGKHNQKVKAYLVHRLDRDASGLLVLARGVRALADLKRQFRTHSITREYELVVHGIPKAPAGRLEHRLLETESGMVRVCPQNPQIPGATAGKPASLDYQLLHSNRAFSLMRCRLHTGRKHQIRVQFAAIGHPVVGDVFYGTPAARHGGEGRLCLHAVHVQLKHPRTGKILDFQSPLPESIMRWMQTASERKAGKK